MRVPEGKQLKDYLPEGTAFQQTAYDQQDTTGTAEIINGYVQEHVGEFTLTVVTHTTHNMTNGACACGLTCAHENIEDGVCTVCNPADEGTRMMPANIISICRTPLQTLRMAAW